MRQTTEKTRRDRAEFKHFNLIQPRLCRVFFIFFTISAGCCFLLGFTVSAGCFLFGLLHCFFTGVARFSDALFTVLYRFIRAAANTRHAMSAVFAPHGFIVFKADIV